MKGKAVDIDRLEEAIGYRFKKRTLLLQAITHSSYSNEHLEGDYKSYERLEFLGDAVLEMVSSDFLFLSYPDKNEGEMTKMRAAMVCEPALAHCAGELRISDYLLLSKGEEGTGGRENTSIIADVMEAIIGAMYLDGGIEAAATFIRTYILREPEDKVLFYDAKSILQEMVQGSNMPPIRYELLGERGPEHRKIFESVVFIGDKDYGRGEGKNKKASEQKAAYQAILQLRKD